MKITNTLDSSFEDILAEIDEVALQKRLSIEAEHLKRIKSQKTLRLYFSIDIRDFLVVNTRVYNSLAVSSSGELKIDNINIWKLITRLLIYDDDGLNIAEWDSETTNSQAFIYPLNGSKTCNVTIKFRNPLRIVQINDDLAKIVKTKTDTIPNIVKELYKYIVSNNLLDHTTGKVRCNDALRRIFFGRSGEDEEIIFEFTNLAKLIEPLSTPISELSIRYSRSQELQLFDVDIPCDDTGQMPFLYDKKIVALEKKIEGNKICESKIRNKLQIYESFAEDPISYLGKFVVYKNQQKGLATNYYNDSGVISTLFTMLFKNK